MIYKLKKFTIDDMYLPVMQTVVIDEVNGTIKQREEQEIPFPHTDGSILDAAIHVYLTCRKAKNPRMVARYLRLDPRELSNAIHILTGRSHDELLYEYRLRAMTELLTQTTIPEAEIGKFFGYTSTHSLNRFLSEQGGASAKELRLRHGRS